MITNDPTINEVDETEGQAHKGAWIEGEIFFNPNLSDKEIRIWWFLSNYWRNNQDCFPSNAYIAYMNNCKETTVSLAITNLKKQGYIKEKSFDGRKRVLVDCGFTEHHRQYATDYYLKAKQYKEIKRSQKPAFQNFKRQAFVFSKGIKKEDIKNEMTLKCQAPAVHKNSVSSIKDTATPVKLKRRTATATLSTPTTKPATKNRTNPYSVSIREIIKHWNSKPTTRKLTIPKNGDPPKGPYTKVTTRYLPKLLAQDGYGVSKIKTAIDVYDSLLSDKFNYALNEETPGHRVGFDEFLNGLSANTKKRIFPNNIITKNVVWLNECMKSQVYLDKKYGAVKTDDFPEWTKEFEDMLLRPNQRTSNGTSPYAEGEYEEVRFQGSLIMMKNGLSIANRNLLIEASKRLNQFIDVYGVGSGKSSPIRWMKNDPKILWVKLLFRAISSSIGPDYEPSLTYLVSAKTYEELLPKFLKDQFMMSKGYPPKEMRWKDYRLKHGK